MKRLAWTTAIVILAIELFTLAAQAATYYIAPSGGTDVSGGGTIGQPFATFAYAIGKMQPGDALYVRGGTYSLASTISISSSKNGTAASPYTLMAYNGETPVLDFSGESSGARGIQLNGSYWNIKGLTVQNAKDNGIHIQGSNNIINQLRLTGNQDSGLQISGSSTLHPSNNLILNTDSYANYDPANHGENADGFAAKFRDIGPGNVFSGDRAWGNSDDGFDFWEARYGVTVVNSWCFKNGFNNFGDTAWAGDGNGLKLGHDSGTHVVQNVLVWGNRLNGIDVNGNATGIELPADPITHGVTVENVTGWNNGAGGNGYNFNFDESFAHVVRNNLELAGGSGTANIYSGVVSDHNSWNGLTASTSDFASLDDTTATGSRQADGSLPSSSFLKLARGSKMIDAGVNVGLPYNGPAPDLGAFETTSCILKWSGAANALWNVKVTANWFNTNTSATDMFYAADAVRFSDTYNGVDAPPTTSVVLASVVTPSSVVFDASILSYAISGAGKISGGTSLVKSGGGTLTISTANDYTGGTIINGGVISVSANSHLGASAGLLTIDKTGSAQAVLRTTASFTMANTRPLLVGSGGGAIEVLGQSNTLTIGPSSTTSVTFNGPLAVQGDGAITVNLSGAPVIGSGASLSVSAASTLNVGGTADPFSGSSIHMNVVNDGKLNITNGVKQVGTLSGNGATALSAGTSLIASSVAQNFVTLGSGATLTIAAVPGGPSSGMDPLTVVPEPSTWTMLVVLIAAGLEICRRRSRYSGV
jgi:autotransporter-associated beta strand protein